MIAIDRQKCLQGGDKTVIQSGEVADGAAMLRFFGMNPSRMSADDVHKHAATLLRIPSYAARWAERRKEQAGLIGRLVHQLAPQPLAAPPSRIPTVPENETPEPSPETDGPGFNPLQDLYIRYCDAHGVYSERRISIHRVEPWNQTYALRAWCHERKEERCFLLDRIEEAVDPETGELIEDLYDWFEIHAFDDSDDDELQADDALGAALAVLIFIARADGRMVQAERDVIRSFANMALGAMDMELLSHSEFDKRLGRASVDYPTFEAALRELVELPEKMRRGIHSVAEAVVKADGKRHYFELEALRTLREILEI